MSQLTSMPGIRFKLDKDEDRAGRLMILAV
jgi:hypothetical protein